jgi:hypothetical protein
LAVCAGGRLTVNPQVPGSSPGRIPDKNKSGNWGIAFSV